MAKRVTKSQLGNVMVGRILSFDRLRGYGFIRTSTGEDILLSSYDVSKRVWNKICIGDYARFVVGEKEGKHNSIVAINTTIIKKMPSHLTITLPNYEELGIRYIYQYGKHSLVREGYKELYPECPNEYFDYVFIKTPRKTYTFNRYGSPVVVDGETDVDEFYRYLSNLLIKYDIDRDYESF